MTDFIQAEPPLTDDEFVELDTLLSRFDDSLSLEELDGFFCAIVVGPVDVLPNEWLPAALGTDEPRWENEVDGRRCIDLLMRHWNTVARSFREDWSGISAEEGADAMYFPFLEDPEASGWPLAEGWARGFRDALDWLDDAHWDALEEDEECVTLLNLISALDTGEKSPGHPLTEDERDEILSPLAAGLQYMYAFWRRYLRVVNAPREPLRAAAVPGRNDLCPCGSGRKFKKCCGAPEKLH